MGGLHSFKERDFFQWQKARRQNKTKRAFLVQYQPIDSRLENILGCPTPFPGCNGHHIGFFPTFCKVGWDF